MTKNDFFSAISATWDERHSTTEEQERLRRFAIHFHLRPGDRVLDAGCGSGRLIPLICDAIGPQGSLVELDFAPGMLEIGRDKAQGRCVNFVAGDTHSLPMPNNDFDKVIALALLPHIDDKAVALKEFHRVLKPGGLLVLAHQLGREALDRMHAGSSEPVKRDLLPQAQALTDLLNVAGFSAIEVLDELDQYVAWALA